MNSGNITGVSDTYNNFHEYEIQWTPDTITWLVDGKPGRVKKRSETWNATANQWNYPQSPSRVQLSIWPGGADTNPKGTIDWAGGPIDWESEDIRNNGFYFATFGEVTVECYDAKSGPGTNQHVSYTFSDARATNDTVIDGNKPTTLKSVQGTGTDMDAGGSSNSNTTAATIPGGTASGPGSAPGESDSGSGSGSGTGGDSSSSVNPAACQATGFSQNGCGDSGSTGSGKSGGVRTADRTLGASAFAALVAVAGLFLF